MIIAPAGSIVQLIYGFVFSLAVLLLTSIMEPYDRRSADCFALLCNFSIISFLFFTLVLRVGDLAKEVEGVLSEEHQALYTYDSTLVSMALITILLASIAVNLLLTVYQIRKSVHDSARVVRAEAALYAARGRMNNPPTCKWKLKDGNQYLTFDACRYLTLFRQNLLLSHVRLASDRPERPHPTHDRLPRLP